MRRSSGDREIARPRKLAALRPCQPCAFADTGLSSALCEGAWRSVSDPLRMGVVGALAGNGLLNSLSPWPTRGRRTAGA